MKRWVLGLLLMLAVGCRQGDQQPRSPVSADSAAGVAAPPLQTGDLAVYAAGRRSEIADLELAIRQGDVLRRAELDSSGAAAAGLEIASYLALIERVEQVLRAPGGLGDDELAGKLSELDSLRLERLVLTVRMQR